MDYARKLAHLSLHFGKLPQHIDEREINRYLASLARKSTSPSLSDFKFTIYGLRYCYRLLGMNEKVVKLPSIKREKKLPVVLNRADVPLSPLILEGLRKYYYACQPVQYLFNGHEPGSPLSVRGMQWVVYAKEPFASPDQVVEYLGRYTHKVAISNHRLRFCQHILPKGFVRIRHYGLLSASRKKQLKQLQKSLGVSVAEKRVKKDWKQICREHLGYDPDLCNKKTPFCR